MNALDNTFLEGLYYKHDFFTETDGNYLLLRFRENSKVNLVIRFISRLHPLSLDEVKKEYVEFFSIGKKHNCFQYRLISTSGFTPDAIEFSELNMALSDKTYLHSLKKNTHIELYAHNEVTYRKITEHFDSFNKIAVIQPTGTGKSLVISRLIMDNPDKSFIVLTPSLFIISEIKKHIAEPERVKFMTYAKAMWLKEMQMHKMKADYLIFDEFHRCGAEEWRKGVERLLENNPDAKILGKSATPIRYLDNARNMADELFENHVAQNLTLAKAIVTKILPSPKYVSALYTFDEDYNTLKRKIQKSSARDKKQLLERLNRMKLDWKQSNGVPAILKKHISAEIHKIIVFCKDISHLRKMKPVVLDWFHKAGFANIHTYEIHSENEVSNKSLLEEFEKNKENLDVLFSVNMLNEGIHVSGVNCVMLLRDTESPVLFFQQVGRCLTINQENEPVILDMVNNFNNIRVNEFVRDYDLEKQLYYDKINALDLPW